MSMTKQTKWRIAGLIVGLLIGIPLGFLLA